MKLPPALQEKLDRLEPKQKQMLLYAGIVGAFALLLYIFSDDTPTPASRRAPQPVVTTDILTDSNTRALGLDEVNARTLRLESEANQLRSEIFRLRESLNQQSTSTTLAVQANEEAIAARIKSVMQDELAAIKAQLEAQQAPNPFAVAPQQPPLTVTPTTPGGAASGAGSGSPSGIDGALQSDDPGGIRTISAPKPTPAKVSVDTADPDSPISARPNLGASLPAGTIITGHLITGVDAPTHKAARTEPYPVSLRVTMESILPSLYTYDLTECFVIAGGFGDLSSERVLFRTDLLSCVGVDGESVQVPIKGFIVGEDGKNGLRGKLVSKEGALVARSMAAGIFDGFSAVFRQAQVPVIASSGDNSAQFQSLLNSGSLQSGVATGAGRALERLSEYYLSLADEMHAIIEVDAGRQIEIILLEEAVFPDIHTAVSLQ